MSYVGTTPKFDSAEGDNIKIDGNTISSTDTDGDINLTPNGTGKVKVATQAPGDNSTAVATTEYVDDAVAAVPTFDPANYYDKTEVDSKDAATLSAANTYTDNGIAAIPAGEVATAANVGTGSGVYKEKIGSEFKFKTLVAGANVQITNNANDITISAAPAGTPVVETFPILDNQTNTLIKTYTNKSKTLDLTYSVNRSVLDTITKPINLAVQTINYFNESITASAVQPDGKILLGGYFTNFAEQSGKNRLIRLNADGTEDTVFSNNAVVSGGVAKFSALINAIAIQSDGKILIGGNFTNYNATGKNYLIRLNTDGTEDTTFSTNAVVSGTTAKFNQSISDILIQPDGKILLGGAFTNYPASAPVTGNSRLIRLNSDGTEDTTYNSSANRIGTTAKFNSTIKSLSLQSDGKLLIGGDFSNYPTPATPTGKNYAIRLNSDGTEDTVFNGNIINKINTFFGSPVYDIAARPDGKVVIAGELEDYGGQAGKSFLIVLNSDGTEDTAFSANAVVSGTTPKFNGAIFSIVCQSDNKIVVGGNYLSYAQSTGKDYLIRFNADGTEDTSFTTNAVYDGSNSLFNAVISSLLLGTDGKIYIGGNFISSVSSINKFRILNSNGTVYNPPLLVTNKFNGTDSASTVSAIVTQADGKVLIGGGFSHYAGQLGKSKLIRLNADGTEDTAFSNNAIISGTVSKFSTINTSVDTIALQPDGKILIGGNFFNYAGQTGKNHLIRLNVDGTEDTAFSANAVVSGGVAKFNNRIRDISLQSDGAILVGGDFTNYGNQTGKSRLIRLNADGTEDTVFSDNAVLLAPSTARINGSIYTIAIQSDGKILVSGNFTNYFATGKNRLMRLNTNGTEDTTFSTNAVVSGTTARISALVRSVHVQADGKILVGGDFQNYFATGKNKLMRLNTNGTEDTAFSANAIVSGTTSRFASGGIVTKVSSQSDGKVIVVGGFTSWNTGTGKDRVMRFNSDGTEDTVFTNSFVLSGTTPKFNNVIYFVRAEKTRIYVAGQFTNYSFPYTTDSFMAGIELETRVQIAKLFGIPTNVNQFSFSTPTTLGPEANFLTGVTVTFGTDGTVKYTSGTLASSDARADVITIETKEY